MPQFGAGLRHTGYCRLLAQDPLLSQPVKKRRCAAWARAVKVRSLVTTAIYQAGDLKHANVLRDRLLGNAGVRD
jgi:hypothetical protein